MPTFFSLAAGAASLRTGVEPGRLRATVDDAFGFPIGQSVWLWLAFALAVLLSGLGSFLPRAKFPFPVAPLKFLAPARWTKLLLFLAAAAGFLWFAAAPAKHAWFFPALILCVAILDWAERAPSAPETDSPSSADDLPLFAGVTVFAAVAGFAAFLRFAVLPTESWYFVPLMALAAGCFEIGLPLRGHGRSAVLGLSAVTVGLACVVIFSDQRAVNWRFTNLDLLCPRLAAEAKPDDLIIVSPWYCGITFQRYFKGAPPWETAPPITDHSLARYDLVHEQMKKTGVMQPLIARTEKTLRAGRRVWVVSVLGAPDAGPPPPDLPPPPLPASGWSDRPYTVTWVLQVNRFMRSHGAEFSLVFETPEGETNFMENLQLYRVEGWRD